jgi:hypothetical protein
MEMGGDTFPRSRILPNGMSSSLDAQSFIPLRRLWPLEEAGDLMLEHAMAALQGIMWPALGMTTYRLHGFGSCWKKGSSPSRSATSSGLPPASSLAILIHGFAS